MDVNQEMGRGNTEGDVYHTSISMGLASTNVVNDSVVIIDTGASANLVGAG